MFILRCVHLHSLRTDLNPGTAGDIYTKSSLSEFIVSYEGVPHFGKSAAYALDFQLVLYPSGDIIFRYGSGLIGAGDTVVAGIQSQSHSVNIPATGSPFGANGITSAFPVNQCRKFAPSGNSYVESLG
jgi:hypothetical protein